VPSLLENLVTTKGNLKTAFAGESQANQKYLATQLKQAEETAQFMDRMMPKLGGKTQAQVDREALEASDAAARDRVDSIRLQSQKDSLNREAGQAQKMVGLSGLTGTDAIRATYQIRIDLAKQLAAVEAERIVREETGAKQMESIARAQAAVQKEMAEAQEEAAMKQMLARLDRRRARARLGGGESVGLAGPGDPGQQPYRALDNLVPRRAEAHVLAIQLQIEFALYRLNLYAGGFQHVHPAHPVQGIADLLEKAVLCLGVGGGVADVIRGRADAAGLGSEFHRLPEPGCIIFRRHDLRAGGETLQ